MDYCNNKKLVDYLKEFSDPISNEKVVNKLKSL